MTDDRDPIAAAFDDYQRPPADIVPPAARPAHGLDDLAALAGETVAVTHYDLDDQGVAKHVEHVTVTRPIMGRNTGE